MSAFGGHTYSARKRDALSVRTVLTPDQYKLEDIRDIKTLLKKVHFTLMTQNSIGRLQTPCMSVLQLNYGVECEKKRNCPSIPQYAVYSAMPQCLEIILLPSYTF